MRMYVVDAFTERVFAGTQAAVCVMKRWLPEDVMEKITRENNLSEPAFAVKESGRYHLRCFTSGGEAEAGARHCADDGGPRRRGRTTIL